MTLATGPGLIVGNSWRGNLNFQLDDLYFGGKHLGLYTSISPSGTWKAWRWRCPAATRMRWWT